MPNVYIDASGNPGKISEINDVPYCAYSAVFLASEKDDLALYDIHLSHIKSLRGDKHEFKSSKFVSSTMRFLLSVCSNVSFSVCTVVGRKEKFEAYGLQYPEPCNKWFIRKALKQMPQALRDGVVYIDKCSSSAKESELIEYLHKHFDLSKHIAVRDAICIDSKDSPGIQVADLISGTIRRSYRSIKHYSALEVIKPHIEISYEFPPQEWDVQE
jgi:hypothetical protein